jgi:hypothetical protein
MANLRDIVIDCAHPASLARFWAAVLDDYEVAPYDDAELARLRANAIFDIEDDPSVLIQPIGGAPYPRIFLQLVPEAKAGKNRLHLDLIADDPEAEAGRLSRLGARIMGEYERHLTFADPEGNEFCLMTA